MTNHSYGYQKEGQQAEEQRRLDEADRIMAEYRQHAGTTESQIKPSPVSRTVTRRKRLAQDIRNQLQTYRQGANEYDRYGRLLDSVQRDLDELRRLENV